jgi:glycosyltransferase involved in cell wall biosynthesis
MSECIVFFATAWGALYGGINSFNYDLCKALFDRIKQIDFDLKIVCIVDEGKKEKEGKDAQESGVQLFINVLSDDLESYVETIYARLCQAGLKPRWIMGHDVKTGERAIELAKVCNVPVALFHHMNYASYKSLHVGNDERYVVSQREILLKAGLIFAIGPRLKESAYGMVGEEVPIIEVLPGLANINIWETQAAFSAITFGRLEQENDLLKQTSLSVAAFAKALQTPGNSLGYDAGIKVVGFESEKGEEYKFLKEIVQKYTSNYASLHPWRYNKDRGELFEHLRRETICMMLSIHEGFGLTGLEAISAGVPLILSKNTGLYLSVENILGGSGTGCLHGVDVLAPPQGETYHEKTVEEVSRLLLEIARSREKAKKDAISLKQNLAEHWTWENTAHQVLKELGFEKNTSIHVEKQTDPTETQTESVKKAQNEKIVDIAEYRQSSSNKNKTKPVLSVREEIEKFIQCLNNLIESIQTLVNASNHRTYLSSTLLEKLSDGLKKQKEISDVLERRLLRKKIRLFEINRSNNSVHYINENLDGLVKNIELILCSVPNSSNYKAYFKCVTSLAPKILKRAEELRSDYQKFLLRLPMN